MFCCIIICIFLTNVLQNLRKRISPKLQDGSTRHGHTLSQPARNIEQPSAHQRNAMQEERKAGEGVCLCEGGGGIGDWLESPVETHSILVVLCLHVLLLFLYGWGRGELLI